MGKSEKIKLHICCILMILGTIVVWNLNKTSDDSVYVIGISFFSLTYIVFIYFNSKKGKQVWIKRACPNIYDLFFNPKTDGQKKSLFDDSWRFIERACPNIHDSYFNRETDEQKESLHDDSCLSDMPFDSFYWQIQELESRKSVYQRYAKEILLDSSLETLIEIERDIIRSKEPRVSESRTNEKIVKVSDINITDMMSIEGDYIKGYTDRYNKKSSKDNKNDSLPEEKSSDDDITYDEIINKDVEFNDDSIYVKKRVWDGVRYTIRKQRVFVYKRDYNLDMENKIPRFHICRCITIDDFIQRKCLTIEYRKSTQKTVLVRNKDNDNEERRISHLPLCKNCYKKMKSQYSWLSSETDNEDFVRNVIEKTYWGPKVD